MTPVAAPEPSMISLTDGAQRPHGATLPSWRKNSPSDRGGAAVPICGSDLMIAYDIARADDHSVGCKSGCHSQLLLTAI
jgi:hypothetical protein